MSRGILPVYLAPVSGLVKIDDVVFLGLSLDLAEFLFDVLVCWVKLKRVDLSGGGDLDYFQVQRFFDDFFEGVLDGVDVCNTATQI